MATGMSDMRLFIRADASTTIGSGHLMRCLALAQSCKIQGGCVTFMTACQNRELQQRVAGEGFEVLTVEHAYPDPADWETTSQALAAYPGAWVVLDGYHFEPAYQRQIKEAGYRLLVIDDIAHLEHYYADVVLNQNLNAEDLTYPAEPYTKLLPGNRYVLLRQEFLAWQDWKREISETARNVLVTLGGGDPDNVTLKVIHGLNALTFAKLEVTILVGGSNPHTELLQQAVRTSRHSIRLLQHARNMPELIVWADVAISAGGSTCWELAFMGLPNLIIVLADNQAGIAKKLDEHGVSINLGWHDTISSAQIRNRLEGLFQDYGARYRMSQNGDKLIDGYGAERVLAALKNIWLI